MDVVIHEGICMGTPYGPAMGVVVEEKGAWGWTGEMRMEPSGYYFPVYDYARSYTFHSYSGASPVPCSRPEGYHTHGVWARP